MSLCEYNFLKIKYIDYFGVEKTFETPTLSLCPEERNGITCDIYIYQNDVLASNFNYLSKKKNNRKATDWKEVLIFVLVFVIIIDARMYLSYVFC